MDPNSSPRHEDPNPVASITFDSLASMNMAQGASARLKSAALKRRQSSSDALAGAAADMKGEGFQSVASLDDVGLEDADAAEAEKAEKSRLLEQAMQDKQRQQAKPLPVAEDYDEIAGPDVEESSISKEFMKKILS